MSLYHHQAKVVYYVCTYIHTYVSLFFFVLLLVYGTILTCILYTDVHGSLSPQLPSVCWGSIFLFYLETKGNYSEDTIPFRIDFLRCRCASAKNRHFA